MHAQRKTRSHIRTAPTPLSTQAFIGQKGADFAPVLSLSQDNWRDVLCRHAVIPYAIHDGIMVMAASTYADATKAIAALGIAARPVSVMIAPRSDILTALSRRYASSLTHHAANGLREAFPDSSAATRIPHWMQFILLATFIVFLALDNATLTAVGFIFTTSQISSKLYNSTSLN